MKKISSILPVAISYFFVLLFCYAGISKILDFENFQVQIAQSPLLSAYAGFISYATIISEMMIVALLIIPKTRLIGLYASLGIMSAFSIYIYLILNYSDFVPCSCGGILEKMGWTEHLLFNTACVILAICAIVINYRSYPDKYSRRINQGKANQNCLYIKKNNISLIVKICVVTLLSTAVVITLFLSSDYIIKKENNFVRVYLKYPIVSPSSIFFDSKFNYFIGQSKNKIYIGDLQYPLRITTVTFDLTKISTKKLILQSSNDNFKNIKLVYKSGYNYLYDGTVPTIQIGKSHIDSLRSISKNDVFFTELRPINPCAFAVKVFTNNKELEIAILELNENPQLKIQYDVLEKQHDGVFDNDGSLLANNESNGFIYVYAYRNQFISMDNNLNLLNRHQTIDTTAHAQVKSISLKNGSNKLSVPSLRVNGKSYVYKDILFNTSYVKGRYEKSSQWKKYNTIDLYNTITGDYLGSIKIEKNNQEKISDFVVTDDYLFVLYNRVLTRYTLSSKLKRNFAKQGKSKT
ncbi:DoxX family protein [Soonwooa purpurea]